MKVTRRELENIIKEALAEGTDLSKSLYGTLEKAIASSRFWIEGNTEDDGDYEEVPGMDLIHQTSAAQYLQSVLQATLDNAGEDIIIAVQSPELDANPGFLLTPDKPQYPDSVISGGYATITPDGKQAVVLNMSLFDDTFNDDDVNAQRIARKGAAILRHEIVHLQQVAARAESEGVSLLDAFENFKSEPKSIPPEGAGRQQYIKSHIEIDAHAHQAADELLSLYGKDEALRLISKTVDFEELGVDLPHAVEDYLMDNPSSKTAREFRKKTYDYINSISDKIEEAVGRVAIRPQAGAGERLVKSAGPGAVAAYDLLLKEPVDILSDPSATDEEKRIAALDIVELVPWVGTPAGVVNGLLKLSMEPPRYLDALGSFAAAIFATIGMGFLAKAGGKVAIIAVLRNALGRKTLVKLIRTLKGPLQAAGPKGNKLAGRLDEAVAAGKSANNAFADSVTEMKKIWRERGLSEIEIKKLEADGFFEPDFKAKRFDPLTPPPLYRDALKKTGYEDAIKIGIKASKFLPDVAYPVFAKKLLVRVGTALDKIPTNKLVVIFDKQIDLGKYGSSNGFSYADVQRGWNKIPNHPEGLGFKDFMPNGIGFNLSDAMPRKELMSLAREMFEQFPAMSKVYDDAVAFVDDLYSSAIKVGGNPHRSGVMDGRLVEITPWNSSEDFASELIKSRNPSNFIKKTIANNKDIFAHEFDHWLRFRGLKKRGGRLSGSKQYGTGASFDETKWLKSWSEFEAEFTTGQMKLLDELLKRGPTDELAAALKHPSAFLKYFLQNLPYQEWQGPVGQQALKTVRKRLFDTERGLYYSLRRALDIAPEARRPLPESLLRDLVREMISEKKKKKSVRGSHPDESYEEGNIKNLMLDKEIKALPSTHNRVKGKDVPVNKQIADYLKKMKMVSE